MADSTVTNVSVTPNRRLRNSLFSLETLKQEKGVTFAEVQARKEQIDKFPLKSGINVGTDFDEVFSKYELGNKDYFNYYAGENGVLDPDDFTGYDDPKNKLGWKDIPIDDYNKNSW